MKSEEEWKLEKQDALDEQRRIFENKIEHLLSGRSDAFVVGDVQKKEIDHKKEREKEDLKKELISISRSIREANEYGQVLKNGITFSLALHLSVEVLMTRDAERPSARTVAVSVYDKKRNQSRVRTKEKFQEHLCHLREMYEALQDDPKTTVTSFFDPGGMELIGIASCFLKSIGHGIEVVFHPTIVGQDGGAHGQLSVRLTVDAKEFRHPVTEELTYGASPFELDDTIAVTVRIIAGIGIPYSVATHVNVTYTLFDKEVIWIPEDLTMTGAVEPLGGGPPTGATVYFDASLDHVFKFKATPEVLHFFEHEAFAVQVWGHNIREHGEEEPAAVAIPGAIPINHSLSPEDSQHAVFGEKWHDHIHKINIWVEIHELDDCGVYTPVNVIERKDVATGNILQIRQGFSHRIVIKISEPNVLAKLGFAKVSEIRIGDVHLTSKSEPLSTANLEGDLEAVRAQFSSVLTKRVNKLTEEFHKLLTSVDDEKRKSIPQEIYNIVKEKEALYEPRAGSGLPGTDTQYTQSPSDEMFRGGGYEKNPCVIYLPLGREEAQHAGGATPEWKDRTASSSRLRMASMSREGREGRGKYTTLQLVNQTCDPILGDLSCVASWDVAAHDEKGLTTVTPDQQRVYVKLQVTCQLAHHKVELVLGKYICLKVFNRRHSFKSSLKDFFVSKSKAPPRGCGARYHVITSIPGIGAISPADDKEHASSVTEDFQYRVMAMQSLVRIDQLKQDLAVKHAEPTPRKLINRDDKYFNQKKASLLGGVG